MSDALKEGLVSRDAFCAEVATVLRRVHAVRFDTFGIPPLRSSGERFPDRVTFMRGYGAPDEDEARIRTLEEAFHMRLVLQLPLYFAFALRDDTMTAWAIKRLQDLLAH